MLRGMWCACGNMKINVLLLLLLSFVLAIGSFYASSNSRIFTPLNHMLLQSWTPTLGTTHPELTWWVAVAIILTTVLGLNTVVCAVQSLSLWFPQLLKSKDRRIFYTKILPAAVHLCFLVMLGGHLYSMTASYDQVIQARPGILSHSLPGGAKLTRIDSACERFHYSKIANGAIRNCSLNLEIERPQGHKNIKLAYYHPVSWNGYTLHLDVSSQPDQGRPFRIYVRKDPGIPVILIGFTLLVILTFWLRWGQIRFRGGQR